MVELFRVDKRDFKVTDVVTTAAEYYEKFTEEKRLLEDRFEKFRPGEIPSRRKNLFLFESLDDAKVHWSKMSGGKLYRVEVSDDSILHRGDMHLLDAIMEEMKAGRPTDQLYTEYWAGAMTAVPVVEVMVASAQVTEVVSRDEQERMAFLRKRYGLQ